jgi:uncharacterized protein (DUF1499 family)
MKKILVILLIIAALFVLLNLVVLLLARFNTPKTVSLGISRGRFVPDPETPNFVSSMTDNEAFRVDALEYDTNADAAQVMAVKALKELPGTTIIEESPGYIHAISKTTVFRFIDDVELYFPKGRVIHFRSASRVGKSDMGVNRKRYNKFKSIFSKLVEDQK